MLLFDLYEEPQVVKSYKFYEHTYHSAFSIPWTSFIENSIASTLHKWQKADWLPFGVAFSDLMEMLWWCNESIGIGLWCLSMCVVFCLFFPIRHLQNTRSFRILVLAMRLLLSTLGGKGKKQNTHWAFGRPSLGKWRYAHSGQLICY